MGQVVRLKRACCPCGWPHPLHIEVLVEHGEPVPALGEFLYLCPECGRRQVHQLLGQPRPEVVNPN